MRRRAPRPKSIPATAPDPDRYVPCPGDACDEAAHRLNVVIRLLANHEDDRPRADDDPRDDDGGFDLTIARQALIEIRDLLQDASREELQKRQQAETKGGV